MKDNNRQWSLFLMSIGLLFIVLSPNVSNGMIMIIGGLIIIFISIILLKKNKLKGKGKKK